MPKKKKGKEMNNPTFEREDSSDEEGNDAFDSDDFNSRDELTPRRRKAKIDYGTKSLAEMRKKKEQQAVAAKRNEAGYAVKKGTKGRYKEQEIKERRQKNQQRARDLLLFAGGRVLLELLELLEELLIVDHTGLELAHKLRHLARRVGW